VNDGRERRPGGAHGARTGRGSGSGLAPGKRALTQFLRGPGAPTTRAAEAPRSARYAEDATDRLDGRVLEGSPAESIDDERTTRDRDDRPGLDRAACDHGPAGPIIQRQPLPAFSSRGATLKEIVQRRHAAVATPPVPLPSPASGPLWRRLDLRPPVQARTVDAAAEPSDEQVHAAAEVGAATPTQVLPYRAELEASLGQDLSSVRAHVGGDAAASAKAMGAEAYARGDDIALPERPSLHTVAHEVTHVLQQRGGAVQLEGGVGEAGDCYEIEADQVADAVARGERVNLATGDRGGNAAVQRREVDAEASGDATDLPAGFEVVVTATLDMNVPEGDLTLAQTRAKLLRAQFRALHRPHRRSLLARLDPPRRDDTLARLFQGKLSSPERGRLLAILRDDSAAATEDAGPPVTEAPPGDAAAPGASPIAAPGLAPSATPTSTEEAILQSSDPAVNGRPVADVGAELHGKAANYGRFPAQQQEYASYNLENEKRILDDHDGVIGGVINLFNDAEAPSPERWNKVIVDWGTVQQLLQAVLAMQPTPANINVMGELTEKGLAGWERAMTYTSGYSDEFLRYLEGFSQAAKSVHAGVELTAEIAMAGAVACAVVLTGPAILAVGGQIATSIGATGAAAAAIKGTTALVGAGLVGGGFKGSAQAGGQVAVEGVEALGDVIVKGKSLEEAAAGFDWGAVGDKGWQGVKTGFIDGVMARGGFAIEAVANRLVGKVFAKFLGPYAGRLYAQVLTKTAERAVSAGIAGGVSGGLDAGARAAIDGRSLPEILTAIESGAKLGAGLGAVFGGIFGAVSETRAARALTAGDDVAPTSTADKSSVPERNAAPVASPAALDVERLDPTRYRAAPPRGLDGTMPKNLLVDSTSGKQYLFKPNAPDAPLPDRALEGGLTYDTIANRAKASEAVALQLDIDTPAVKIVEYDGQVGSLQEWRTTRNTYREKDLEFDHPDLWATVKSSPELARYRADLDTFDYVLNNLDRNGGNLLVSLDDTGKVIGLTAIDHDLTFTRTVDRLVDTVGTWARGLPERYSREMVAKLRVIAAEPDAFRNVLRSYLSPEEIEASITRVERILDDVDAKVAMRGEAGTFWEGAEPAVDSSSTRDGAAGSPLEPDARATDAGAGVLDASDDRTRAINRDKPAVETDTRSRDGVDVHNDIRAMSPEARHVVRQLEARGWVRVDEIAPSDLVAVSKWFGKEIAVVQAPYGRLRVVLGTEDGILVPQIAKDEVFVMHTHPVMTSMKDDFGIDLAKAGKQVEAVVDWSGQVTYYSKAGIRNPISPQGYVEPLVGYKAAFIDQRGMIVGFARVDISVAAGGETVIKVTE
jgi:hypothetical protein